jgi:hypothetical protein
MLMPRLGVDYEIVKHAAVKLLSQGIAPSVQKVREELGTGSNTTIAEHLKVWRDEYAKKTVHHLPANMPKELISAFEVLWQTAMEHAQNHLVEHKKTMESERDLALQNKKAAEKAIADLQSKLAEASHAIKDELVNKQKLSIELAVANDRLIKQEQTFITQKNHYEDRLKRVYKEKDSLITEYQDLQVEIKLFHEKLRSQAKEHEQLLAQQHSLHEQSETRWLTLIDQARQETREERKKLEHICQQHDDKIKNTNMQLINTQSEMYEKSAQLKAAQDHITQFKQEIKHIQKEYIKSRATIMKFEKERIPKRNIYRLAKKR